MNDTADYARLKQAYFELLDLDPAARLARLSEVEAAAPGMAAALRRQLHAAEQPLPMLDRAAQAPAMPHLPNYRVLRELGRGGMGVVWLAERALGDARQPVALKQIVHGAWSEDDLRRFQRERRILATLDHPNIATLVDGGTDAHGVAFIATQYIEGERLDRWCEAEHLDARARVQLLARVAAAVAHAHGRLVVHRDLKPANILVTREGVPKLLDFGIARALAEEAVTTEGPSQMTLRYAAPEQIESHGAEAGVSVDVYALGVLLYELVARASPYGEPAGPAALVNAILRQEPSPPSRAPGAVAGADADLDAICLRALRKAPAERYASAAALREDLERWLARQPVEARRGERGYRLRRAVRRHWPWLAAAVAAAALLAGFAAYEVRRSRAELAAVAQERDKARSIAHFFEALFAAATPAEVREGIAARELLRRSAERLEQGTTAPMTDDARAALFSAAAGVMVKQDLLPEAARMFEQAIELWQQAPVPPSNEVASAMHERARIAYIQGEPMLAQQWQGRAVALMRADPDSDRSTLAGLLNALAVMQWTSGKGPEAMRSLEEAKLLLRGLLPEGRTYYANTLRNLAMFQLYAGQAEAALANAREGVAQHDLQRPVRERERLGVLVTVAASLRELGRFEEAEAVYRESVGTLRARGEGSNDLVEALNSHAKLMLLQQRWSDAEATLREVEAIHVANGGERHARALAARADLALVEIGRERWERAEAMLAQVLQQRPDAGAIEPSTLAGERVAHAYAACRAAPRASASHVEALGAALQAMRRDPPLPRRRLAQGDEWLVACRQAAGTPPPG